MIKVDQGERSDTAASQRFCSPRPDAANANHGNMRLLQRNTTVRAIQTLEPSEAALSVRSVAQLLCYEVFLHDLPKKPHWALDKSAREEHNLPLIL